MRGLSSLIGHIVVLFMVSFSFVSSPRAQSLKLLQRDGNLLQKNVRHIFVKTFLKISTQVHAMLQPIYPWQPGDPSHPTSHDLTLVMSTPRIRVAFLHGNQISCSNLSKIIRFHEHVSSSNIK